MSRAMRRHPLSSKPSKRSAPIRPPRPGKTPSPRGRRSWRSVLMPRWVEDIVSELRKVTWPTRHETVNLTIVVLVVAAVIGFILGGIDVFFNWLISHTLLS